MKLIISLFSFVLMASTALADQTYRCTAAPGKPVAGDAMGSRWYSAAPSVVNISAAEDGSGSLLSMVDYDRPFANNYGIKGYPVLKKTGMNIPDPADTRYLLRVTPGSSVEAPNGRWLSATYYDSSIGFTFSIFLPADIKGPQFASSLRMSGGNRSHFEWNFICERNLNN